MIIFGITKKALKTFSAVNYKCTTCDEYNSTLLHVYYRYFHVFWIPMFPLGKKGEADCEYCGAHTKSKKLNDKLKLHLSNFKNNVSIPKKSFTGTILLCILIIYSIEASNITERKKSEYIQSPHKGDVYFYDVEPGLYSCMKVYSVKNDSVFVQKNKETVTKFTKSFGLNRPEKYETVISGFKKSELIKMKEDKIIYSIDRD